MSVLDPHGHDIAAALAAGRSAAALAVEYNVGASTMKDFLKAHPQFDLRAASGERIEAGGQSRIVLPNGEEQVSGAASDADALVRSMGLDPNEYNYTSIRVTDGPQRWVRLSMTPKRAPEMVFPSPGTPLEYERPDVVNVGHSADPVLYVVMGDEQCPYNDKTLHELSLQFLRDVQPDYGIMVGDTIDLPTLSHFKRNPAYNASPQECLDTATGVIYDRVRASATQWTKLLGNHDIRLRDYLLANALELYGVRPGSLPGEAEDLAALSVRRLLRLDELGVALVEPERGGNYTHASIRIGKLQVRHGRFTGPNASRKTLDRLGHASLFGHTHAKDSLWVTRWDIEGNPETIRTDQIGCMCEIADGLGYDEEHSNWQQGFVTVTLWPDGYYNIDHATYVNGTLLWRGERWDA